MLWFELAALRLLGHLPALDACAECGGEIARSGRVPFGLLSGGTLCAPCRAGKQQVVSVSAAVLETLRKFAAASAEQAANTPLEPAVHGELRGVWNHYLTHLLGFPPKMHHYLGATTG